LRRNDGDDDDDDDDDGDNDNINNCLLLLGPVAPTPG
jgi:hypothetical protein